LEAAGTGFGCFLVPCFAFASWVVDRFGCGAGGGINGLARFGMQKAWEAAQAPVKNLLMMGFMMWMAGSTVHLFSIGITFSALWQPVSSLQSIGKGTHSDKTMNGICFR